MMDDKYDLMRHPNIRLTEDGGAAPYDYTQAKDAADDIDYSRTSTTISNCWNRRIF